MNKEDLLDKLAFIRKKSPHFSSYNNDEISLNLKIEKMIRIGREDLEKDIKSIKLTRDEAIEYLRRTKGKVENPYLQLDIDKKFTTLSFMN